MAKRLKITYGDTTLYDDEPENFTWRETAAGAIEVKAGPQQDNPLNGLLTGLQQRAKQQQQQAAQPQIEQ